MKKVLIVFPYAIVGGIETLFATLLKNIERSFEYKPIIPRGLNPSWVALNLVDPLYYTDARDLALKIDQYNPDLIVGALNFNLGNALTHCKRTYPVVETSHNVLASAHDSINLVRPWIIHDVCVSAPVLDHISSIYSGPSSVILTGIDTSKFRPNEKLNSVIKNYAYFGRLTNADKYINALLESFNHLPGVNLNIYGTAHTTFDQQKFVKSVQGKTRGADIRIRGLTS
jgi:glycosyltransferase involved in cell wall biosynthesis